jgi:hypothetical protein
MLRTSFKRNRPQQHRDNMKQTHIKTAALAALALGLACGAQAQSSDSLIEKLVQKGVLSEREAQDLRDESDKDFHRAYQSKSGMPDWLTAFKINGDLRLRYENFNFSNSQMAPAATGAASDRHRYRYRYRLGFTALMQDNIEVGMRLTSSEPGTGVTTGDPISGNTTFQDNGSKKLIFLDQAYVKWMAVNKPGWSLTLTGGKMENPFTVSDIVFDGDYTPEGGALTLTKTLNDQHGLKLVAAVFMVDEAGANADDPTIFAAQGRWDAAWSKHLATTFGLGVFSLSGSDQLGNASVPNQSVGNTRRADGNLMRNYNPFYADAALTYTLENGAPGYKAAFPIRVAGDFLYNPTFNSENKGWSLGLTLGKSGKKGLWDIGYRYKYLERDAWYEELPDSDSGAYYGVALANSGLGTGYRSGTNVRGHVIKASYSPYASTTLTVSYLMMDAVNAFPAAAPANPATDTGRLQVDLSWKF